MSASVTLLGKLHEQLAPRLCEALERERETGVKMNPALMRVLVNFLKDNGIKPDGSPMTPTQRMRRRAQRRRHRKPKRGG